MKYKPVDVPMELKNGTPIYRVQDAILAERDFLRKALTQAVEFIKDDGKTRTLFGRPEFAAYLAHTQELVDAEPNAVEEAETTEGEKP
jgi:hypothetical protein